MYLQGIILYEHYNNSLYDLESKCNGNIFWSFPIFFGIKTAGFVKENWNLSFIYQKLQKPYNEEQIFKKLLNGISTHKYKESAELVPEVFGLSASNMSRRFKYATASKLRLLQTRSLRKYDFAAIFTDGKRFAEEGIVIFLGITIEGKKLY